MIKAIGWLLLIPSVVYLAIQCALFINWLVVRDSIMSWNIPLLIASFLGAMTGEGLREYSKHNQIVEANNAKR